MGRWVACMPRAWQSAGCCHECAAVIVLDGLIGEGSAYPDEPPITAEWVAAALRNCPDPVPHIRLSSHGGCAHEGLAIHHAIRADPRPVVVTIRRIAASAGAVVAMAGTRIEIEADAALMIHGAFGFCLTSARALKSMAAKIDASDAAAAACFARVTGRDQADELRDLEAGGDRWMDSRQALACRYVHAVIAAQFGWDP